MSDAVVSQNMRPQGTAVASVSQRPTRARLLASRRLTGRAEALPREAFRRFARALQKPPL